MAEVRTTRDRDVSPDSVILTFESNFNSLFSSASASVEDRCSFASDAQDHDSLSSQISQHLSGPDLNGADSNKPALHFCSNNNNGRFVSKKVEKAKVHREENKKVIVNYHHNIDDDGEIEALDSAKSSFSQALKDCQERRSRSKALKILERQRPASLDLNNASLASNLVSSSPKFGVMKKASAAARKAGNFPSPGTPNYRTGGVGIIKGWSSERVQLASNGNNRRLTGAALLPLSNNGRVLPSKWEDAERWIFSPVSGDGGGRISSSSSSYQQPLKRPKSKSGPLSSSGITYHSPYSPAAPMYEGGNLSSHMAGSPFSAGVMLADGWCFRVSGEGRGFSNNLEPSIARSVSVHGCTDLVCQETSLTNSQDEGVDDEKDAAAIVSCSASRRDMATQMSPEGSCHSSPRSSFSQSTPSNLPIAEVQSFSSSKSEVRDVQIDEQDTLTQWPKKYRGRNQRKGSDDVDEWKLKAREPRSSAWEVSETLKSLSKARRDEAKITAWENLQKAKADAAIRKLEMKLEKKRSSSMDKIMKKLRSAQKKAQEMRSAILTNQALQVSKTSNNPMSFRIRQMGSLSGCFTCHAF